MSDEKTSEVQPVQPVQKRMSWLQSLWICLSRRTSVEKRKRYPADFIPFPTNCAAWQSPATSCKSLEDLFNASVEAAQSRIEWYNNKCKCIGFYARNSRFLAILFVGFGGLAPLFEPVVPHFLSPQLAMAKAGYIALGLAALLVGLDNALGLSISWMRYRVVQTDIIHRLARFRYDWAARLAGLDQTSLKPADYRILVEAQRDFVDAVETAVESETRLWADNLTSRLQSFDDQNKFKHYGPAAAPGTIEVTVLATPPVDADTIKVTLDSGAAVDVENDGTVRLQKVSHGHHVITATAKRGGADVSGQGFADVTSGQTVQIKIRLP